MVMGDRGRRRVKSSATSPRTFQILQSSVRSSAAWIASLRFPLLVQSGYRKGRAGPQDSASGTLCLSSVQSHSLQSRTRAPLPSIIHHPPPPRAPRPLIGRLSGGVHADWPERSG